MFAYYFVVRFISYGGILFLPIIILFRIIILVIIKKIEKISVSIYMVLGSSLNIIQILIIYLMSYKLDYIDFFRITLPLLIFDGAILGLLMYIIYPPDS
jgi:hypothetical protein